VTSNPIPRLGFGTYGRRGPEGVDAMLTALETGYRHLDTAQDYENETEVGQAVARSGLPRESIFVTTKIAPRHYPRGSLLPSLRESLDKLSLDQVDLTLLHWPSPNDDVPLAHYVEQLAEAQSSGLSRLIGVANFTIDLLEQTIAAHFGDEDHQRVALDLGSSAAFGVEAKTAALQISSANFAQELLSIWFPDRLPKSDLVNLVCKTAGTIRPPSSRVEMSGATSAQVISLMRTN